MPDRIPEYICVMEVQNPCHIKCCDARQNPRIYMCGVGVQNICHIENCDYIYTYIMYAKRAVSAI